MTGQLTFGHVFAACRALTVVQRRNLCRLVLAITDGPADTAEVETWQAIVIWCADTLASTRLCSPDQQMMLLTELRDAFVTAGGLLDNCKDQRAHGVEDVSVPAMHVGFIDRRFVTVTAEKRMLDLQTGEKIAKLPHKPLETVAYDLTVIYLRRIAELDRHADESSQTAPGVD